MYINGNNKIYSHRTNDFCEDIFSRLNKEELEKMASKPSRSVSDRRTCFVRALIKNTRTYFFILFIRMYFFILFVRLRTNDFCEDIFSRLNKEEIEKMASKPSRSESDRRTCFVRAWIKKYKDVFFYII